DRGGGKSLSRTKGRPSIFFGWCGPAFRLGTDLCRGLRDPRMARRFRRSPKPDLDSRTIHPHTKGGFDNLVSGPNLCRRPEESATPPSHAPRRDPFLGPSFPVFPLRFLMSNSTTVSAGSMVLVPLARIQTEAGALMRARIRPSVVRAYAAAMKQQLAEGG